MERARARAPTPSVRPCDCVTIPLPVSERPRHACPICGARYINRRHLVSHMRQHQGETTCPFCQKVFTLKYNMRRHMVLAHDLSQEEVKRMTKTLRMPTAPDGVEYQPSWSPEDK